MKNALIYNDTIVQIKDNIFPVHPDFEWVECPEDVTIDWDYEEGSFLPPVGPTTEQLTAHLANYRWEKETGGIEVNGMDIHTDRESQSKFISERIIAKEDPDNYSMKWKTKTGWVTINGYQMIALTYAVRAHVVGSYASESLVDIELCETFEEVEAAFDASYENNLIEIT